MKRDVTILLDWDQYNVDPECSDIEIGVLFNGNT